MNETEQLLKALDALFAYGENLLKELADLENNIDSK